MEPAIQIGPENLAAFWDGLLLIVGAGIGTVVSGYYARKSSRELRQQADRLEAATKTSKDQLDERIERLAVLISIRLDHVSSSVDPNNPIGAFHIAYDHLQDAWWIKTGNMAEPALVDTFEEAIEFFQQRYKGKVYFGPGGPSGRRIKAR